MADILLRSPAEMPSGHLIGWVAVSPRGLRMARARAYGVALAEFVAVMVLVGIIGTISLAVFRFGGSVAAFCPANAVPLSLLLVKRPDWRRIAVIITAACLGASGAALIAGTSINDAIGVTVTNGSEIAVAIWFAWLPLGPRPRIRRLSGLLKLIAAIGVAGPAAGALAGLLLTMAGGSEPILATWRVWFAAHALGNLIFTTAGIVILNRTRQPLIPRGKMLRAWLALSISMVIVVAAFQQESVAALFVVPLLFAFLGLITGFEFTCLGVALLALYALGRTAAGHGPIVLLDPVVGPGPVGMASRILLLQAFIFAAFTAALPIALIFERRGLLIEQLRHQKALVVSRGGRYRALAEMSADTILVTHPDGTILYASPAAERLIGISGEALKGRSAFDLMHPDDLQPVRTILATLSGENREITAELRLRHDQTADHVWTEVRTRIGRKSSDRDVELVSVVRDISLRRAEENRRDADLKRLDRLANTDPLTGLANRRRFNDHLETEWRRALRDQIDLALILVDVDLFKAYNDCYGHPAGDAALRRIAAIVGGSALRPGDLATRIGGEEFAIILPMTFLSGARAVAERIQQGILDIAISHQMSPSGFLSVSIGIDCVRPDRNLTPGLFIERADRALYQAKGNRGSIAIAP